MAVLMTPPFLQFFDDNGAPLAGGKVYTYTATGTFATQKATYTTEAGDVEHANPIILDSAGRPDAGNGSIWLSGTYDFVVKDSSDVTIETTLNVTAFTALPASSTAYFQTFSGTGSQTAFTTSSDLGTDEKAIFVWVDNGGNEGYEIQNISAYTINGTTLTFSSAPSSGTNNIYVSAPSELVGAASSSAAAASASAAAAAASASSASTSATTASGFANQWDFDSSTTMADPGSADIRLNNATLSSVTQIAISANSGDTGNPDLSDYVATWDDNTNASGRGTILLKKGSANENFAIYNVTGAITDNTSWLQIPVTHVASSGSFSNTDALFLGFSRSGTDGAGTGTVTSVASGDGLTGGPITTTGTLAVDINGASSADLATGDEILFGDVSDSNNIKKDTIIGILELVYPVGSCYMSKSVATNPGTLLGFGTWTAIDDKFIVARGSTYTGTGGSATATLSEANLPSHYHFAFDNDSVSGGTEVTSSTYAANVRTGITDSSYVIVQGSGVPDVARTSSVGSGSSFSILPPYQAVYIWERTA